MNCARAPSSLMLSMTNWEAASNSAAPYLLRPHSTTALISLTFQAPLPKFNRRNHRADALAIARRPARLRVIRGPKIEDRAGLSQPIDGLRQGIRQGALSSLHENLELASGRFRMHRLNRRQLVSHWRASPCRGRPAGKGAHEQHRIFEAPARPPQP